MDTIMADSDSERDTGKNIALRTRSHLKIADSAPNDNLDFPDVDIDLYQNPDSEGDSEYRTFLNQCYSAEVGTETNNEDNDPEYVYNDDIFSHGWSYDLDELSKILISDREQITCIPRDTRIPDITSSATEFKAPAKSSTLRRKIDMFDDPEFARILNQQLRQHIQLLTQAFLLTKDTTNMRNEANEAKSHLFSYMKIFKNKSKPSNLLPALELVNNSPPPKDLKSSIRLSWRPLPIPDTIKTIIQDNPNVFLYPSLLPKVAFSILPERLNPKKAKINFTINEDKLLAYALNEFKGEVSPYAFIASLLMTAKTKTQISNHIKNIKRSAGCETNPIKLYYATGEIPDIDIDSDSHLIEIKPIEDLETAGIGEQVTNEHGEESKTKIEEVILVDQNEPNEEAIMEQKPTAGEFEKRSVEQVSTEPNPCLHDDLGNIRDGIVQLVQPSDIPACDSFVFHQDHDELMNMDLDDLMAASTTISKTAMLNNTNNSENKNIKNLKLKKSMLNLMSHNFLLSDNMGDLIIYDFLKTAQQKLSERNNIHLLQLLTDLMGREINKDGSNRIVTTYQEISNFLTKINAPTDLHEKMVLFLDMDQATKCGCSSSYLHWMRFFEFMQHVELYHDGVETLEKKLVRLIDALQKDDQHKIKLAIANLVNKHPFLKREFESLSLKEKPHPSLFICEEDFDDITEPISTFNMTDDKLSLYSYEHFNSKISKEELSYASPSCPCKCHSDTTREGQPTRHCGKCNLKFMKGRIYLVDKIKPILAEWSYTGRLHTSPPPVTMPQIPLCAPQQQQQEPPQVQQQSLSQQPARAQLTSNRSNDLAPVGWTFEEDREILEFCRLKAEQNEETISFDTATFEELVNSRRSSELVGDVGGGRKKSARDIAERFNQLMEMYKDENSNNIQ